MNSIVSSDYRWHDWIIVTRCLQHQINSEQIAIDGMLNY